MNSRAIVAVARRLATPKTVSAGSARSMSYGHGHAPAPRVTMNDLPIPEGSWKNYYDQQQRRYNTQLIVGVSFFLFTVGVILKSDIVEFNFRRPKLPDEE